MANMIGIDPRYCDEIRKRWLTMVKEKYGLGPFENLGNSETVKNPEE